MELWPILDTDKIRVNIQLNPNNINKLNQSNYSTLNGKIFRDRQHIWLNFTQISLYMTRTQTWHDTSYEIVQSTHTHIHTHSEDLDVTVLPSNLSQRGITLCEHSKPVNLENNTVVIHVFITQLNIKHLFVVVEFPAGSHCIMAGSHFEKSVSTEHSNK